MNNIVPSDIKPVFPKTVNPDAVREKLMELLGLGPVPEKIECVAGISHDEDGIRLTRISFQNSLGEPVPTILMHPTDSKPNECPGVVCVPGTGGSAERVAHNRFYREAPDRGPLYGWGRELARRGFAALAISPKGCVARCNDPVKWQLENQNLAPYGITQMGILVEEVLKAARVLAAQEIVARDRLGITGMSLGGNATWYALACAPWLRSGVPICGGLGRLDSVIHSGDLHRHSAYFYIPHMLRHFDHPEVVSACVVPRPFMMVSPTQDEDMPRSGVDDLMRTVKPAYEVSGLPDNFKVYQPDGNHVFKFEYFEWMVDWFNRYL